MKSAFKIFKQLQEIDKTNEKHRKSELSHKTGAAIIDKRTVTVTRRGLRWRSTLRNGTVILNLYGVLDKNWFFMSHT